MPLPKPSRAEVLAAHNGTVPDVIAHNLKVLFCGINPSLYSVVVGHHFARPGNRFYPALHRAGFTDWQLDPSEDHALLELGYGITNVVERGTATADELSAAELVEDGKKLRAKVEHYKPRVLAVLGIGAYRTAFDRKKAVIGLQPGLIGTTRVWVLPNPSGLNAHYRLEQLAEVYRELREAISHKPQI